MRTQDTGGSARRQRLEWGNTHGSCKGSRDTSFLSYCAPKLCSYYRIYYHFVQYQLVILTERYGNVRGIVDSWTHHISSCQRWMLAPTSKRGGVLTGHRSGNALGWSHELGCSDLEPTESYLCEVQCFIYTDFSSLHPKVEP